MQRKAHGQALTRSGQGLLILLMAFCLLAVGTPAQADPPGEEYSVFLDGVSETADGLSIEFFGQEFPGGTFKTRARSLQGNGNWRILDENGDEVLSGSWVGTTFRTWELYDHCGDVQACVDAGIPANWTAGVMTGRIAMEGLGVGNLTVFCLLPGISGPNGTNAGTNETFNLKIGSLNFNVYPGPGSAGTLFILQ